MVTEASKSISWWAFSLSHVVDLDLRSDLEAVFVYKYWGKTLMLLLSYTPCSS